MSAEQEIPVAAIAALSTLLLESATLDDTMRHVCETVVQQLEGAAEASVTLVRSGKPFTYGATSTLPLAADERQYAAGRGPCLDAALGNQTVIVVDASTDDRWPEVLAGMVAEGICSSMSIPLPVQGEAIGALNIYASSPDAFTPAMLAVGQRLASFAAVVVANAVAFANVSDAARNMQTAMESRAAIEQAKGIIMARAGCDADTAFGLMVQQSQYENRKLRDIAAELVERAAAGGSV
ncbi:MAG TPA: GAF and ANTAR domain-containing protein [Acidimicrobiales bacterium]|nr:GAF and ANTAR domain-containing protein [Acidimicrobiales bacterium]